jgi:hypothetical protein
MTEAFCAMLLVRSVLRGCVDAEFRRRHGIHSRCRWLVRDVSEMLDFLRSSSPKQARVITSAQLRRRETRWLLEKLSVERT